MNQHIIFDRTRYTDKLRDNGVDEKTARAHSDALDGALRDAVATKSDLDEVERSVTANLDQVERSLTAAVAELRTEISELRNEFKTDISELRNEFKADMLALEGRMDTQFANVNLKFADVNTKLAELNTKIETSKHEFLRWMIGSQLALAGLIAGLLFKFVK